jgi:hypothetical protein
MSNGRVIPPMLRLYNSVAQAAPMSRAGMSLCNCCGCTGVAGTHLPIVQRSLPYSDGAGNLFPLSSSLHYIQVSGGTDENPVDLSSLQEGGVAYGREYFIIKDDDTKSHLLLSWVDDEQQKLMEQGLFSKTKEVA